MTSLAIRRPWLESSNSSVGSIDTSEIDQVEDYDEIFELSDLMGVDLGGLDEIEEMKERLHMHLRKNTSGNIKNAITGSMLDIQKDDKKKREKLHEVFSDCRRTLASFEVPEKPDVRGKRGSKAIEDLLKVEGAANNFEIDFQDKLRSVEHGECVIVVSGETSAGKSSVLNLLFEKDILPVHHNSCTSVITRISYGPQYSSIVVMKNGEEKTFTDPDRIKEDLWNMIYVKDEAGRDMVSDIKEVNMKIPSSILEPGIVFVDSPGIGENEAMDSVIADYVEENEILGFMYVIKSDNSGGVEEDRLINLVKLVLDKQNKKMEDGMVAFNPKSAIFICNRWDLVKKDQSMEEVKVVYDNAVKLLGECWPGLEEKQVVTFSTHRAEMEQKLDEDYITDEFKILLESIKELYMKALHRRIKYWYRWIERVLSRSVHHIKSVVKQLDTDEKTMGAKMAGVYDNLNTLKANSSEILSELKVKVEEKYKMLCDEFRNELRKPAVRMAVTQWINPETPDIKDGQTWEDIKEEINLKISNRISDALIRWEEEVGQVQSIEDMVVHDIKFQLRILQEEVGRIEDKMQDNEDPSSSSSDQLYSSRRRLTLGSTMVPVQVNNKPEDIQMPVKLATRLSQPVTSFMKKVRKSMLWDPDQKKIKMYKNNPCLIVKQRTEKILNQLINPGKVDILLPYISSFMNRPVMYLDIIEKNIPALIEANEQLLDHVAMCRVDANESRALYENMMEDMEKLKLHLIQYGQGHIFVDDFVNAEIKIQGELNPSIMNTFKVSELLLNNTSYKEANRRTLPRGLWTALQSAFLNRNGEDRSVTIKVYLQSAGVEQTFPEVSKLRFLDHESVAKFMGIHHSDFPSPAFVYDHHLKSVKRYLLSTLCNLRHETERIVHQAAEGLDYLHQKHIVHMEFNTNTVTVDPDGMVQLTGGCLPRLASFPLEKEKVQVGDFVYLSPSVLNGQLYISSADVYAFGLFLIEVVAGYRAYEDYRQCSLQHFSQNVDPEKMLDLDNTLSELTNSTAEIIRQCVSATDDDRPSVSEIIQVLSGINEDVKVIPKKSKRKRVIRNKRSSSDGQS